MLLGLFLVIGLVGLLVYLYYQDQNELEMDKAKKELAEQRGENIEEATMDEQSFGILTLTSPVFDNNYDIPEKYTCDGENISPPLKINDIPDDAKSFVLIVEDPDAPGGLFTHWTMWNIPTDAEEISENSVPNGARQGKTSFGDNKYGGPCPPSKTHRYFFKLYALDNKLDLPSDIRPEFLKEEMEEHLIANTLLIGKYKKK